MTRRWLLLAGSLLATSLTAVACDEPSPAQPTPASASARRAAPLDPVTKQTVDAVARAASAAKTLRKELAAGNAKAARKAYLSVRREVAASQAFLRDRAQLGAEVLLGPLRSVEEGGGALALLDAALGDGNTKETQRQLDQVERSLALIETELRRNRIPAKGSGRALSDAAFELGLMLLEAYPAVPAEPDAVLADLHGTVAALEDGSAALVRQQRPSKQDLCAPLLRELAPIKKALAGLKHAHQISGRAALVMASGRVGAAARKLAAQLTIEVKPPLSPRQPQAETVPITALTLPGPRRDPRAGDREAMADLGKRLFVDKRLSKGAVRGCRDCHLPDKAYSDGLPTPRSLDPTEPLIRNTPTLLYTSLHAAQLWDGRFASAERQALKVIHATSEMGLDSDELEETVAAVPAYQQTFTKLFDDGVTAANVARALVAFEVRDLVPGNAPIDRYARGDAKALDAKSSAGLDVFAGAGRCARCHVPPLFGGSRPPDFSVAIYAALGVTSKPGSKQLDGDKGRGDVTKRALDQHAFKTPTVRNIARTAPYFHHGGFSTLEQVVDFYNQGGGNAVGAKLDNQDPDVRPLKLDDEQVAALIAFMRDALADADIPALK